MYNNRHGCNFRSIKPFLNGKIIIKKPFNFIFKGVALFCFVLRFAPNVKADMIHNDFDIRRKKGKYKYVLLIILTNIK